MARQQHKSIPFLVATAAAATTMIVGAEFSTAFAFHSTTPWLAAQALRGTGSDSIHTIMPPAVCAEPQCAEAATDLGSLWNLVMWMACVGALFNAVLLSNSAGPRASARRSKVALRANARQLPPVQQVEVDFSKYPGHSVPETAVFAAELGERMRAKQSNQNWRWEDAKELVNDVAYLLRREPAVVHINVPVGGHINVVGDVHGQFFDLFSIWRQHGLPSSENPYLFNGDMVDRGSYSVEMLLSLFAWKAAYPEHVHLARGNHELSDTNRYFTFFAEVSHKYNESVYRDLQAVLDLLPVAHVVNDRVFVVHGGLPSAKGISLQELEREAERARSTQTCHSGLCNELLWTDPQEEPGYGESHRGGKLQTFGPDVTDAFLQANNLQLLVRSHEVKQDGYEYMHGGKCLTVFSAPNYCDRVPNRGAVVRLNNLGGGGDLQVKISQFEKGERPAGYVPAMSYRPLARYT